jgi:hypothetical protein
VSRSGLVNANALQNSTGKKRRHREGNSIGV